MKRIVPLTLNGEAPQTLPTSVSRLRTWIEAKSVAARARLA